MKSVSAWAVWRHLILSSVKYSVRRLLCCEASGSCFVFTYSRSKVLNLRQLKLFSNQLKLVFLNISQPFHQSLGQWYGFHNKNLQIHYFEILGRSTAQSELNEKWKTKGIWTMHKRIFIVHWWTIWAMKILLWIFQISSVIEFCTVFRLLCARGRSHVMSPQADHEIA